MEVRYDSVCRIVTATSRPKRLGEVDGEDYMFLRPAVFRQQERERALAAVTDYAGHRYGVPVQSILAALEAGMDAAVVVDVPGVKELSRLFPDRVVAVLLEPPAGLAARRLAARDGANVSTRLRTGTMVSEVLSAKDAGCVPLWADDRTVLAQMLHAELVRP